MGNGPWPWHSRALAWMSSIGLDHRPSPTRAQEHQLERSSNNRIQTGFLPLESSLSTVHLPPKSLSSYCCSSNSPLFSTVQLQVANGCLSQSSTRTMSIAGHRQPPRDEQAAAPLLGVPRRALQAADDGPARHQPCHRRLLAVHRSRDPTNPPRQPFRPKRTTGQLACDSSSSRATKSGTRCTGSAWRSCCHRVVLMSRSRCGGTWSATSSATCPSRQQRLAPR